MKARKIRRFVGIYEIPIGIGTGLILCALAGFLLFREGVKQGKTDQKLEQLAIERDSARAKTARDVARADSLKRIADAAALRAAKSVARSDSSRAVSAAARSRSAAARADARGAQAKVVLRGDTAIVGRASQVLLPEIGSLIRTTLDAGVADSITIARQASTIAQDSIAIRDQEATIKKQAGTIAAKDIVIADLIEDVRIADEQISTLGKAKRPLLGFKSGVVAALVVVIGIAAALK
ncbi:MAG TPA: hypothetical protein VNO75_12340 [Gemmatimonadaceae bacterium]|nr:hypothetical protein [Gemmatimonadaceae bacterium]